MKYKIVKCLHSIPFIETYLVSSEDEDKNYIIKSINITTKTDDEKNDMLAQINLLKKLDHQNIIKIIEIYYSKKKHSMFKCCNGICRWR